MEKEALKVLDLFAKSQVEYKLYEHEPVYTSEQASRVRGVELKTGVKALVLKKDRNEEGDTSRRFLLADIAADRKIDFRKLETLLGLKKHLAFATREEVISSTGCEPGSVHPIGRLYGLDTYLDRSVLENEYVNFNIGLLTKSVRIRSEDLLKLLEPKLVAEFSK